MELLAYVLACSIIIYQVKEDVEISCWFLVLLTSIATLSGSCLFVSSLLTNIVVIYLLDFRILSLCRVDKLLCNPCSL